MQQSNTERGTIVIKIPRSHFFYINAVLQLIYIYIYKHTYTHIQKLNISFTSLQQC